MRCFLLATSLNALNSEVGHVEAWMEQAYYPVLLLILVVASLGVPIPEDIPLIVAGVLLKTQEAHGTVTWYGTFIVALIGIMSGDLVLYTLGRRWGPDVVSHRSVRWLITPKRYARLSAEFQRHGTWMCFVGRFIVGVRAAMCMTAGATRFPYWRFFLADFCGALLSIPFFVVLGYLCADMIPKLLGDLRSAQTLLTAAAIGVVAALLLVYTVRKRRRARRIGARREAALAAESRTARGA